MPAVIPPPPQQAPSRAALAFEKVRQRSLSLAAPLSPEDATVQSMPEASPAKWHLAHTTWFFEQFVLGMDADYRLWQPAYAMLFNSYYEAVGPQHPRAARGQLTRPGLAEVLEYRAVVDERMRALIAREPDGERLARIELGLQHEQQHQELLLTDIKHLLSQHPLHPAYRADLRYEASSAAVPLRFLDGVEGLVSIGHDGDGFAYDCETPRHQALLTPHAIANRPVSNAEYAEFVRDGGYRRSTLWLAEGWETVEREGWRGPLYWSAEADSEFTLAGQRALQPQAPVCHISYYEADAFARWAGARLPTEAEWEAFTVARGDVQRRLHDGNLLEREILHPQPAAADDDGDALQLFGDVWEWTASPYVAYPRFRPLGGALGEYNGKFMCGQFVLRGGSCVTPAATLRPSYRNFFYPRDRWQFMGARLARDC
jgi:ergothioneine biosynthesis protein EgtB